MFKNHTIKSNHKVLKKNELDTYGPPVFAPDYRATVLAENLTPNEHYMYIRFLCHRRTKNILHH
jgi:hypothetical protein